MAIAVEKKPLSSFRDFPINTPVPSLPSVRRVGAFETRASRRGVV
jgi:hypothetical protein